MCGISLPVEIALELSLFFVTRAFCFSYASICFPDKVSCACVLGFLSKGHSDWCLICSLWAYQEADVSLLWTVTAVSSRCSEIKSCHCGVTQYSCVTWRALFSRVGCLSCGLFPFSLRGLGAKCAICKKHLFFPTVIILQCHYSAIIFFFFFKVCFLLHLHKKIQTQWTCSEDRLFCCWINPRYCPLDFFGKTTWCALCT